jgi:peptidoglycan/LPS O-acetylase OafA/YrhL
LTASCEQRPNGREESAPVKGAAGVSAALPRCPRYPSLDMWRGVACLSVVIFHSTLFCYQAMQSSGQPMDLAGRFIAVTARGWAGVPLFFVISGYCISATADSARRKNRPAGRYFVRRFRRIFPPYWICLGLTAAFAVLMARVGWGHLVTGHFGLIIPVPHPGHLDIWQWLGNWTLTETWRPQFGGHRSVLILGQAWTLCYEEQFYAVMGLLLLIAPRRFFLAATVLSVAIVASCPVGFPKSGFFWDGRWLLFAAGIGVYYALNYAGARGRAVILAALVAGAVWDVMWRAGMLHPRLHFSILQLNEAFASFTFAILILALHPYDNRICAVRALRPLFICGQMCYSLYLVHYPVTLAISHALFNAGVTSPAQTIAVTLPVCVGTAVAVGWAFHLLIERRFMNPPAVEPTLAPVLH